jgi:transposase
MHTTEIFNIALGLSRPWYISEVELLAITESKEKELHIYPDFEKGFKFKTGNNSSSSAYDTEEKMWQHLNFFQHRCCLHARVPRVKDAVSGKVSRVQVPWAREGSGFTLLFEAYAMLLIESEMPVCKAAENLAITAPRLWRVFDYRIEKAVSCDSLSATKRIGTDETSRKKGHEYITQAVDSDARRTVFVTEGKGMETVEKPVERLEKKGGKAENIELISMDMYPAFIAAATKYLPEAKIVFDKFHLVKLLNEALDETRRLERKGNELLKNHRYTILKKYDKLSSQKKSDLQIILDYYPSLGKAYRLRQLFLDMFEIDDKEEAMGYLWFWCEHALDSGIQPFKKFVNMVKAHWWGIVQYFHTPVTNGILEGINSKIQLAKRRARGYRNPKNFINMIYFTCAKLKFDFYPHKTL